MPAYPYAKRRFGKAALLKAVSQGYNPPLESGCCLVRLRTYPLHLNRLMPAEGTRGRFGRDAARFDWPQAAERILPQQRDDALRFIGAFFVACRPEHGMQSSPVSNCVFAVNIFQVAFRR